MLLLRLFRAHRNELFRGSRVDADRRIELGLRGAALESDRQSLHDLRRVGTEHVTAEDAIRLTVHDELHEAELVPPRESVLQRPETALVDVHLCTKPPRG